MRKIVVAITGASGSIYASLLIRKITYDPFAMGYSFHRDDKKCPHSLGNRTGKSVL